MGGKWRIYHKEIIEEMAKKSRLEKNLLKEIDEKNIPLIEKMIASFFGKRYPSLSTYYKHLVRIISDFFDIQLKCRTHSGFNENLLNMGSSD